jgi:transcriptional regulator
MQSPEKRRSFIIRGLRLTRASMTAIAKRAGYSIGQVHKINRREGIRYPELAKEIGKGAELRRRAANRRRINFFSYPEKVDLIKRNTSIMLMQVKKFWGYTAIRTEYTVFNNFLEDVTSHILDSLDYYDPKRTGKDQRPLSVTSWINNQAKWFCLDTLRKLRRKLRQMPVDREGMEIEPARSLKPIEFVRATRWELARIPAKARTLLQNLGLDLNDVAQIGYGPFRDLITRIALAPETKLNEKETFVIFGRLKGKKLEEIGKEFAEKFGRKVTRQAIDQLRARAIAKIKKNWNPLEKD